MSEIEWLQKLEEIIPDEILTVVENTGRYGNHKIVIAAVLYLNDLENKIKRT